MPATMINAINRIRVLAHLFNLASNKSIDMLKTQLANTNPTSTSLVPVQASMSARFLYSNNSLTKMAVDSMKAMIAPAVVFWCRNMGFLLLMPSVTPVSNNPLTENFDSVSSFFASCAPNLEEIIN